jgi:hypothetical protein
MFAIFNIITQIEVHLTILNLLLMTYKERERERLELFLFMEMLPIFHSCMVTLSLML